MTAHIATIGLGVALILVGGTVGAWIRIVLMGEPWVVHAAELMNALFSIGIGVLVVNYLLARVEAAKWASLQQEEIWRIRGHLRRVFAEADRVVVAGDGFDTQRASSTLHANSSGSGATFAALESLVANVRKGLLGSTVDGSGMRTAALAGYLGAVQPLVEGILGGTARLRELRPDHGLLKAVLAYELGAESVHRVRLEDLFTGGSGQEVSGEYRIVAEAVVELLAGSVDLYRAMVHASNQNAMPT